MNFKLINLILICLYCIVKTKFTEDLSPNYDDELMNQFLKQALNITNNLAIIIKTLSTISTNESHIGSISCIKNLSHYYHLNSDWIEKTYEGSSKGFIDLNSFYNCFNYENSSFFTIYPKNKNKNAKENITRLDADGINQHCWVIGICLAKNFCNEEDIKILFQVINQIFNYPFAFYNQENIEVVEYNTTFEEISSFKHIFPRIIPLLLIIIQIIFMIVKIIPVSLYGCILKRKYIRDKNLNDIDLLLNNPSFLKQVSLKIKECFSLSYILEDLSSSKKNELFKEEELTYIKGIKTLGILFFVFGINFSVIYNHPLSLSGSTQREEFLSSREVALLVICFRLAPGLILSSSGYSLCYKFISFLDKKLTNIGLDSIESKKNLETKNNDNKNNNTRSLTFNETPNSNKQNVEYEKINKTEKYSDKRISNNLNSKDTNESNNMNSESQSYVENTLGIKFYLEDLSKEQLNQMFKDQRINDNLILSEISPDIIPNSLYFNFVFHQTHKIFLIPICIMIYKYSFPLIAAYFGSPLFHIIYKDFFQKLENEIVNYLFFGNFVELFQHNEKFSMTKLFIIPICELNFFVLCSVLIFISYKKKLRLDLIIFFLIIFLVIFKAVYILVDINSRNPGTFYFDSPYQNFFFNPIFNFDFYLIGMLFGLVNYVVQNEINKNDNLIDERPFVIFPITIYKLCTFRKKKKIIIHFIFIIILLISSLIIIPILFSINFQSIIKNNDPGYIFSFIASIDIEIFLYCFHFFAMGSYVSGKNIFYSFLNAPFYMYIVKLGFWISLGTPTVTYIAVYSNEANFDLRFFMVIFYGFIILSNLIIISLLIFITMEMPYKKLIKLYFNINTKLNKVIFEDISKHNRKVSNSMILDDLNENDIINDTNNQGEEDNEDDND